MPPKVSVIMPVYNGERFIRHAVESVFSQTYQDWELIVVDDGSTDNTVLVLEPYMDRLKYIWQHNQERSVARNNGVNNSRGDYLVFLDSDDVLLPPKLEYQVDYLEENSNVDLVYSPCKKIDIYNNLISDQLLGDSEYPQSEQIKQMILGNYIAIQGVMMRSDSLCEIGGFEPDISCAEDRSLWLRFLIGGYVVVHLPQVVAYYRLHERGNLPHPQAAESNLQDTLKILNRAKNNLHDELNFSEIFWNHAIAKQCGYFSMKQFALNQVDLGVRNYFRAAGLDPQRWLDPDWLANVIAQQAVSFSECRDYADPVEFVKGLFQYLPQELGSNREFRRKTLAHTYIAYAFYKFNRKHPINPLKNIFKGVWLDPTWLRNKGVISIALKSLDPFFFA